MPPSTILSIVGIYLTSLASAALTTSGFSSQCENISFRSNWLIADCPNTGGKTVSSSIYLYHLIKNDNGKLVWDATSTGFSTCRDCKLTGSSLQCGCTDSSGDGAPHNASLNLEDHIASYSGHLLSDLNGNPTPPSVTSTLSIPRDFTWDLYYGKVTCNQTDIDTANFCKPEFTCAASPTKESTGEGPAACFKAQLYLSGPGTPAYFRFSELRLESASKEWQALIYDNLDCTGDPITTVSEKDDGVCTSVPEGKEGKAVRVQPAWNAPV